MDFSVDVDDLERWAVVRVHGDVDVATAPRLREHLVGLVADGRPLIVLDLDGVDFLDSTGLGVIVGALKRARTHGGDLRIVCTRPRLRKVFELTALDRALPLSSSAEDAVEAAAAPQD
jgi:anti-sigma B factor antagonist